MEKLGCEHMAKTKGFVWRVVGHGINQIHLFVFFEGESLTKEIQLKESLEKLMRV